jgi:hypothetical protein
LIGKSSFTILQLVSNTHLLPTNVDRQRGGGSVKVLLTSLIMTHIESR